MVDNKEIIHNTLKKLLSLYREKKYLERWRLCSILISLGICKDNLSTVYRYMYSNKPIYNRENNGDMWWNLEDSASRIEWLIYHIEKTKGKMTFWEWLLRKYV